MDEDNIDFVIQSPDNIGKDVIDENTILIKKEEFEPVNNIGCRHSHVERDPTEELGEAWMCKDCHIGWIQRMSSPS